MDVLFLDANILFSAAYRPDAGLRCLWQLEGARLVTSAYAVEEARRNLDDQQQRDDLATLAEGMTVLTTQPPDPPGAARIELPEKDRPILLAAVSGGATHLLTGDVTHFGRYFGQPLLGVLVMTPGEYLRAVER